MNITLPSALRGQATGRARRRLLAGAVAATLLVGIAPASIAATKVTVTNKGGITAVGPTNSEYGYPSYYQDKNGVRVEPCLEADNPLCGFLPGDVPDPDAPISFPENFPEEFFYQLIGSDLTLPGGGRAVLTLGIEAAFANGEAIQGDQTTFARTRIVVRGATPNTTLTFKHPFGELTIDTDGTGAGRLVEDISPAVGNFTTVLKSNYGPFLKWDPAVAPAAPAGYLGDPAIAHTVTGGAYRNTFSVSGLAGGVTVENNLFTVSGKIATNTGVTGDKAVISSNRNFVDVFATSAGDQLQVVGVDGKYATTPMTNDTGSQYHYARVALLNGALPTSVVVENIGDKPVSNATIKIADVIVTKADYDGTTLSVSATSSSNTYPIEIVGVGTVPDSGHNEFAVAAPPATIQVKDSDGTISAYPVTITGGAASPAGLPTVPPAPDPGPVTDNTPNNPNQPPVVAAPVVSVAAASVLTAGSVVLDASATSNATSYIWTVDPGQASGITLSNDKTAKPTLAVAAATTAGAPQPWASTAAPVSSVKLTLVATGPGGSTTQAVTVPVKKDVLTVTGRHRVGTELRIDGTSLVDGAALTITPQTTVVIWKVAVNGTTTTYTKLGTSPVDTLGNWSLKQKPGPSAQVTSILVQSTRGGEITGTLATR